MKRVLLLTGQPGTGKTVLIKEALTKRRVEAAGFFTEEIRSRGIRQGFRIVTLDGQEAILAHIKVSSPHQVSKYRVDIDALDRVGVSTLRVAVRKFDLIVIDEIGKMELISPRFRAVVTQAINSGKKVLGTIMLSPHPFVDEIKRRPEVESLLVTRDNHIDVLDKILNWLPVDVS